MSAVRALRRALRRDARLFAAVFRWAVRRPGSLSAGSRTISYGRDQVALLWVFMAVTAGEILAVELLVPWMAVRLLLLVFGIYAVLVMAGYVAANRVLPHIVSDSSLTVRCGLLADVTIPLASISSVGSGLRAAEWGPHCTGEVLTLGVGGQTHLEIVLFAARPIEAGKVDGQIRLIRCAADDPSGAVRLLRAALTLAPVSVEPSQPGNNADK